jgi:hypothetical protein
VQEHSHGNISINQRLRIYYHEPVNKKLTNFEQSNVIKVVIITADRAALADFALKLGTKFRNVILEVNNCEYNSADNRNNSGYF